MSEAINAAALRWRQGYPKYCTGKAGPGNTWFTSQEELDDARSLADAWVADHAAREAEAQERRLPIDAEWLEPLCERVSEAKWYWYINEERGLYLIRWAGGFHLKLCDQTICDQANRGHVLYMMSALGIPVKTQ